MASVTLSSKFQVVIPKSVRDRLQLKAGQKFRFITKGPVISLVPERNMAWGRGILKGADPENFRDRSDRQAPI